jgi:hypothetical protein
MPGANGDPTAGLKGLKYAKGVTKVGTENINGKNTIHYRATVPADKTATAADMYKGLGLSGEIATEIWVDDKGSPARLNQTIGTTNVAMDFLAFGGGKTVEVPPAADTADMTELYREQVAGRAVRCSAACRLLGRE